MSIIIPMSRIVTVKKRLSVNKREAVLVVKVFVVKESNILSRCFRKGVIAGVIAGCSKGY